MRIAMPVLNIMAALKPCRKRTPITISMDEAKVVSRVKRV